MDFREVGNISESAERTHWWFLTRFLHIDRALRHVPQREAPLRVIEFGCGTGPNLWYLRERSPFRREIGRVVGVDPHVPANYSPGWVTPADEIRASAPPSESADLILAMDVLEHIEDDEAALREWTTSLAPDGRVFVTVPAFSFLWSQHDDLLGHERRYTKAELVSLGKRAGLEPIDVRYAFSFAFPVVLVIRALRRRSTRTCTDLQTPSRPVNALLKVLGRVESWLGGCPLFGTTVTGVFRRPASESSVAQARAYDRAAHPQRAALCVAETR